MLNVDQSSLKAIIGSADLANNNVRFNIGSASVVNWNHMAGAGSATMIRIGGSDPTIIEGALNSPNGAIYLINQNGILFANGSRVDVNGLVASALNLSDSDFGSQLGHLNAFTDGGRAAYVWGGGGAQNFQTVLVRVEPDARIKGALGSSVMLFAPTVINQGSIETTEGQVVLAAGEKVYLSVAPDLNKVNKDVVYNYAEDSAYRGLAGVLVEVDSYQKKVSDPDATPTQIAGEVANDTMGRILAERGNVTMASFLVNQNGRVTATSSVAQKGSIRLLARDTIGQDGNELVKSADGTQTVQYSARLSSGTESIQNTLISASRTGKLVLGANSVTAVLPQDIAAAVKAREILGAPQPGEPAAKQGETSYLDKVLNAVKVPGSTITDDQIFNAPTIEAVGRQVIVEDNAKVVASGGFITMSAQKSGLAFNLSESNLMDTESRLYLGNNTLIDVAGLQNVNVALDRNFVELLLTLNDLKDNPLNRDGFLYREKVWLDIRKVPDSRVADVAGFVKQVPRSVGEKLAEGGTVKLQSEGDLIQGSGSKVDASGGSLKFNAGINKESWLTTANGKSYALGDAPVDTIFTGFLGGKNSLAKQEAGYTEGKAGGAVEIKSYNIALDGQLAGNAVYGIHQRESDNLGGKLTINVLTANNPEGPPHSINIGSTDKLASSFSATDLLPAARKNTVEVDAGMLSNSGFEELTLQTAGNVKVNSALNLAQGAKLALSGRDIEVNKNIVARGGSISLESSFTVGTLVGEDTDVTVANGVTLDVSGNWVNDTLVGAPVGRVVVDGGDVSMNAGNQIEVGSNSLIDVSGGGWLKRDKTLVAGDGGDISIVGQFKQSNSGNPFTYKAPVLNGELRGYALGEGGSLSIAAPFITIGNTALGDAREFLATPELFKSGGFTSFNLTGREGVLVRSNTNVDVIAKNYQLNRDYSLKATGAHVDDFANRVTLPDYLRSSTSLSLATRSPESLGTQEFTQSGVSGGSIVVETGAKINVDSNGRRADGTGPSIELSAWDNQIYMDGTLKALGGDIALTMNGNPSSETIEFNAAQAIWLGEHASLLASGYVRTKPDPNRLRVGTVYDAGNITLGAAKGYIVAESGSIMDVSGASAIFDVRNINRYTPTNVASNGGDISLIAREGMLLDGTFKAAAPGALAGSLEIALTRGAGARPSSIYNFPGSVADPASSAPGNAPDQLWYVDIAQSGTFVPGNLDVGDAIQAAAPGVARISANNIMSAGFSEVGLKSEYGVRFNGDVDLTASRTLSFNTRVIEATPGAQVNLNAPNVIIANQEEDLVIPNQVDAGGKPVPSVGFRSSAEYSAVTPVTGSAALNVNSRLIDLQGRFALSGFSNASFNSSGEIRLTGNSNPNIATGGIRPLPTGELLAVGDLTFNARQIYPTTISDFTITTSGAGNKVTFNGTGSYDKVLSAGGKLTVNAETIDQNGVLLAPFGSIALNASQTLNLNAGSVTSVSAQGALIPFGYTARDGQDYSYDFGPASQQFKETATGLAVKPVERTVKLTAPDVNQAAGSTVDVSGGGDMFAYEWIPGIGGSKDVLANGADQSAFGENASNTWAIMPANNQTYASYDPQYWEGSEIKAGDAVYISGVPGLAAGYYTLMPARYALLPGAMLVSAVTGYQDRAAGQAQTLQNGSTLVSGHLAAYTSGGYVQTSRNAGF
ncbi:MAG: filamentous hemagglutinin N-terminal domain-containing protein, partial [Methylophilaceae bacterium]